MELLTTQNILFAIAILSLIFGIYKYFSDPQIRADKTDALLLQQLSNSEQGTDRRFKDMQDRFDQLVTNNQNHLHTVDTKVDALKDLIVGMGKDMVRVQTILEERLPPQRDRQN